jgi:hypothetical protein
MDVGLGDGALEIVIAKVVLNHRGVLVDLGPETPLGHGRERSPEGHGAEYRNFRPCTGRRVPCRSQSGRSAYRGRCKENLVVTGQLGAYSVISVIRDSG